MGVRLDLDPTVHPIIQTTVGSIPATTLRIMVHELGHALMGIRDVGVGRMDNVRFNENPIIRALGEPDRIRY